MAARLNEASIATLSVSLRDRGCSAEDITRSCLEAINAKDGSIHAYLEVFTETAIAEARAVDASLRAGESLPSPLAGIPVAVKDNILVRDRRATAGSKILEPYVAAYDATAITKLREARAVLLGKTNLDEFAMGSSTENSAFGPTRNPRDPDRVPGGSSGGSAAAVAANFAIAALGSDTGGSIRQPAAFCGIVGLKPTYGAVSRSGLIAMASSLDQIGTLARSVADVRFLYEAIRGHDPFDASSLPGERRAPASRERLVVGVPKEYFTAGLDSEVGAVIRGAIERCRSVGAEVREVTLPHAEASLAAYYLIVASEVSANLARFDGIRYGFRARTSENLTATYQRTRGEGFGPEVKRRIMLGTFALSHGYYDAYYLKAERVRRLIRDDFERAFREVDVIAGPTTPAPAFRLGEKTEDPLQMYLEDVYTVAVNLAGLPALSLPAGSVEREGKRLPVGLQLIAPWFAEDSLLNFAERLEAALATPHRHA